MTIIIALLLAPFFLLTLCFAVEVFAGLKPLPAQTFDQFRDKTSVIIVPAHDEENVLEAALEKLKLAANGNAHVLLVADNCTDRTAEIGRGAGFEVIERQDADRRGKGYALDFARAYLKSNPPDIVVIIDADCSIDRASVSHLVEACASTLRPCQATNLQRPAPYASPAVQLSTFAFFIKNVIRQRALQRLAARVHLLGTGMALPWALFAGAELATSNIVEDLALGQELADAGQAPLLIEAAEIWSNAETDTNTMSQRRRWEGGFIQNALRNGPKMLARAFRTFSPRLLWAAIDTMIPPFALLIALDIAAIVIGGGLVLFGLTDVWPLLFLFGALLLAFLGLSFAWSAGGARFVTLASLGRAPLYLAWKLPMYLGFAKRGTPKEWTRTGRL